ncbi:hypothetical protein GGR51DRAFT_575660 [Nemania sp. FL0031]|nr:hypothetical protein GGR51DRAFT_575660 [Nemania sp. FL0031]
MTLNHPPNGRPGPPPRPKTPTDYIPTPVRTVAHTETIQHLVNSEQKGLGPVRVHAMSRDRFAGSGQLSPRSPTASGSIGASSKSKKSILDIARRGLSLGRDLGRATIDKTRPVVRSAIKSSKKATSGAADHLNRAATSESETIKVEVTSFSSSLSEESLFKKPRLPKLQIPDVSAAVDEALNTACSTDTQKSSSFGVLGSSPTSRDLKFEWTNDDHSKDVAAEFHNMLSARRRVRKGKFGRLVAKYQRARPTWDDSWSLRISNDNEEDRKVIGALTEALQEQKDHATRAVQKNPSQYPGFESVSTPGCTLKLYWQHKSSYR